MEKREVLYKILCEKDVVKSIVNNFLTLEKIIPEISLMVGFEHNNPNHCFDVWGHTLKALSYSRNSFEIRLALLLHDIGKPLSFQDTPEKRRFRGHPIVSEQMTRKILSRLEFDKPFVDKICYLVKHHDDPITKDEIEKDISLQKTRFEIQKCDGYAHAEYAIVKRKVYNKETEDLFSSVEQNL